MINQALSNLSEETGLDDNWLYDGQKNAGWYTWFYYNFAKYSYLCKFEKFFFTNLRSFFYQCPAGCGRGAWSYNAVLLEDNLKKLVLFCQVCDTTSVHHLLSFNYLILVHLYMSLLEWKNKGDSWSISMSFDSKPTVCYDCLYAIPDIRV